MKYDVIVVGGGAAGMMAALTAAEQGSKVLLLERNDRLGKKLLITGKGRCNVTNSCSAREVLENTPRNGRFLFSVMESLPPDGVFDFFEKCGCQLKIERGNRVFPVTDRSQSVLECLQRQLRKHRVTVHTGRVTDITAENGCVTGVKAGSAEYQAENVILATGGVSYPATGSTGDGYILARRLGHTVVEQEGSLVPLEAAGEDCPDMQGLSLRNVAVKLLNEKGKTLYKDFGELLFTHFGVSGPTVLSASAHMKNEKCRLVIDLKPALDMQKLEERLMRDLELYRNRSMENALTDILPRSIIPVILRRLNIPGELQANSLKKEQRQNLVQLMKAFSVDITGKRPVSEAIITRGGIQVSQINPKTMESKLISGLYFAGEIIDCDAYTGGFNLQIAWATGYAAGMSVKNHH